MSNTIQLDQTLNTIQQVMGLYERFKENEDMERAEKAEKLLKKLYTKDFIVAFCGHFSAGKSTMINALLGEEVLPSSPIPTSANLVRVHKSEKDFAKVYYTDESALLFKAPYDFQTVKEYCKNGQVKEIEIGKIRTNLSEGITVMDTPGVDSTDDAHRISTESAIHLADIVFYVMDYNHVQSELNFMYTKELLSHGVELYLIINQIDKHNEEELSFSKFKDTVKESFSSWNVHPAGIFYTSLKNPNDPSNQFSDVKSLMEATINEKDKRIEKSARSAINLLVQEHYKWLNDSEEDLATEYKARLERFSQFQHSEILEKESQLIAAKQKIENKLDDWKQHFNLERDKILKNALLMPYQTRELAESFLTAIQPDFKVGLLFGKRKKEQEQENRLELFYKNVKEQVDSQINWHLHQFANSLLKEANMNSNQLHVLAQKLTVHFEKNLIQDTVKKGARLTGEYVLNYCDELAERLKKIAIQACESFKQSVIDQLTVTISTEIKNVMTELDEIKTAAHAVRELEKLTKERIHKEEVIYRPIEDYEEVGINLQKRWKKNDQNVRIYQDDGKKAIKKEIKQDRKNIETKDNDPEYSIIQTIDQLDDAVLLLNNRNGFGRLTKTLAEKAERLKNKQYTIALFGAFSAGKSSFANALLGEKVLPVSPNPTTAAINRICPPTNEHHHGTAMVRLKSEKQLLEDVQSSLKEFGVQCQSLQEAYSKIPTIISHNQGEGKEKIHLSFLKAFTNGFEEYGSKLGLDIEANIEQFRGFVANESQSCFVNSIDLYYDSELTRKGITLVDTPGADSINARHTGVAFEYIKNADAILFVTYYNHAFSKADREFLIQLGRVKDAFELDKMFFIVNAIDLANSKEELEEVLLYVRDQLTQYGIRFPRLFGVSSLLAIQEPTNSHINAFNLAFYDFLEKDLMKMAIQSAQVEINRGIQMVNSIISSAMENQEEKAQRSQLLLTHQEKIEQLINQTTSDILEEKLIQEQKELLFYVKQRVFFRFSDFFKESFNPALLQKNNKSSLNIALAELLKSVGFDFSQEMRATTLRLEMFIKNLFHQQFEQIKYQINEIQEDITLSSYEVKGMGTPEFSPAFVNIDKVPLEKTFKYFKNAKAFFEKNDKQMMQDELEKLLQPYADEYLAEQSKRMYHVYEAVIDAEFAKMREDMISDVKEQFTAQLAVLNEPIRIEEWIEIRNKLAI